MVRLNVTVAILAIILAVAMVETKLMNVRRQIPPKFALLDRASADQVLEFSLALKQYNMDVLEATLLDISNPESVNYGKWWTTEQILDLIAPSVEEVKPVVAWLKSHGVEQIDVSGRDVIKAKAPIRIIEKLFQTEMHNFKSTETGKIVARAFGEVHVADNLHAVEAVMGITELVPKSYVKGSGLSDLKRNVEQDPLGYIYPGLLRKMYQIPATFNVNPKSSFAVVEYQDDPSFTQPDLAIFNQQMNENAKVQKIVGPYAIKNPDVESTLDVQYGAAIGLNTTFWFWTVENWLYEFATDIFNAKSYPLVVSMSWGWPETLQCEILGCNQTSIGPSLAYVQRVNKEYIKIGLKGITLLAASGDEGASGDGDIGCANVLSSIFPGASPWVTCVGGTMLVKNSVHERKSSLQQQPPVCSQYQCATVTTETVSSFPTAKITSGGGFSNISTLPGWQADYVNAYLKSGIKLPIGKFDPTKRAFPDVAANAHNYLVNMKTMGGFFQVDGTSASTPVFGGMISLLNSYLLNSGKSSIGFANPLLYKMYAADKTTFTDITTGNNYCAEGCCGNTGYIATKGWDPVTGLGTPIFPKMQSYLKKNVVDKK